MTTKVEMVIKNAVDICGEGPHWEDKTQTLLYVDVFSKKLFKWCSITNEKSTLHFDENVSLVIPTEKNDYIITQGNKLARLDWETKNLQILHEAETGTNYNDGKCDAAGRLFAGTWMFGDTPSFLPPVSEKGFIYSLDVDGSIQKQADKMTLSNGLAWTHDNRTMFFVDSYPKKVYVFDFDLDTGTLSNQRILLKFGDYDAKENLGLPDGMAIDTNDKIWIACFAGGKVVCFDPPTGKILQVVNIDALNVTSCCFGGPNLDELYVTSARNGLIGYNVAEDPLAGSIFKVTGLGVKGYPANNYLG